MTKIVCVGFQKTGTSSLGVALTMLGFETAGWTREVASLYKRGRTDAILDLAEDFDAFEDLPWYLMYRELHARFPDCKFILTTRTSYETWFESLRKHVATRRLTRFSFLERVYGTMDVAAAKAHVIATHRRHVEGVREFARAHDIALLEMCFERQDGWDELCAFVGKSRPDAPFPHTNKATPSRQGLPVRAARRVLRALDTRRSRLDQK